MLQRGPLSVISASAWRRITVRVAAGQPIRANPLSGRRRRRGRRTEVRLHYEFLKNNARTLALSAAQQTWLSR